MIKNPIILFLAVPKNIFTLMEKDRMRKIDDKISNFACLCYLLDFKKYQPSKTKFMI